MRLALALVLAAAAAPLPSGTIVARREGGSGHQPLMVDEDRLFAHGAPIEFTVLELCRFDDAEDRWRRVALPQQRPSQLIAPLPVAQRHGQARVAQALPDAFGLYRVRWREGADHREALLPVGRVLCEDLIIGPAPAGQVAACVPHAESATARFVPLSKRNCED
jgi:hypothetical protein